MKADRNCEFSRIMRSGIYMYFRNFYFQNDATRNGYYVGVSIKRKNEVILFVFPLEKKY